VVDSNGQPDQTASAQGSADGTAHDAAGANGDKSNDKELILAKDFGIFENPAANYKIQGTAEKYGVNLSRKASDALRKEMNDNEAAKLQNEDTGAMEKLNIMRDIGNRVLKDQNVSKGVKDNLQDAAKQIENALKEKALK